MRASGRLDRAAPLSLPDPATVAVVGGGPAGSFFALRLLRRAQQAGRRVRVVIFEKKTEVCFYRPAAFCSWEGCNYCAGGISPRLADSLRESGIALPADVVESRATEVTVHGDWKSIQLPVPDSREMLSVFRGSRPRQRLGRYANFDTFLLQTARERGAEVVTGEVRSVARAPDSRPVLVYELPVAAGTSTTCESLTADFAVFATGVNAAHGTDVGLNPLFQSLRRLIPELRPPKVRQALIAEMQAEDDELRALDGEVHFVQYGSGDLHVEMASLIPKGKYMTVVLLGKSIDEADPSDYLDLVRRFVELPHIRRLLPLGVRLHPCCCCHPYMAVGGAAHAYDDRVAMVGDLAVSRLYKDGLYSAHVTSAALADCILEEGIDGNSLARRYAPVVAAFSADNRFGRVLFTLSRGVFGHPALSRVLYQAVLTERKTTPYGARRLAAVLWRIASGDDSYRRILRGMLHPASLGAIVWGGLLATLRNQFTEQLFGLDWTGVGRYPTGVPLEEVERKRQQLFAVQSLEPPSQAPEMERMYSIRIRAGRDAIFRQLGAFGEPDRGYLTPRFTRIQRVAGEANQVGARIRYAVDVLRPLTFEIALEKAVPGHYLLYRILDGFGRGGILAFDVEPFKPGVNLLTIYVGFDFERGVGPWSRLGWWIGRKVFPQFAHDVVWNHSLCKIKQLAEADERGSEVALSPVTETGGDTSP